MLEVDDLTVTFRTRKDLVRAVRNVSFRIGPGETFGLVGESGCGKSTIALTLATVLASNAIAEGSVRLAGQEILGADAKTLTSIRRSGVAMVYQDPARSLNPTIRVGEQVAEAYVVRDSTWSTARDEARRMLRHVQIADADLVMRRFPHELSGGMQQRVVIAMALAKNPRLLVLDEPTTGLDATVEAEVLDLIAALRSESDMGVLFISHDLGIVARMCDRVGVMYAGRVVEHGPTDGVFAMPEHPYTASLLRCLPTLSMNKRSGPLMSIPGSLPTLGHIPKGCVFADRCAVAGDRCVIEEPPLVVQGAHGTRCFYPQRVGEILSATPPVIGGDVRPVGDSLLRAEHVSKTFHQAGRPVRVLTDVSIQLHEGETLGIVGESGSGKTTLARILLGLVSADDNSSIQLVGETLEARVRGRTRAQAASLQVVFQNPDSALNRRHSIRLILSRAIRMLGRLSRRDRERRIDEIMEEVRLPGHYLDAKARVLSGGMKQRVAIARAYGGKPRVIVCDEPTSALDVSVQAAILNLFVRLQQDHGTAYIFISHNLPVVRYLADRIMVLYLGRIMETASSHELFEPPFHPYTEALISTALASHGRYSRIRMVGDPPSVADPPTGCVFQTRCPRKVGPICETVEPPIQVLGSGRTIRCHIAAPELHQMQTTLAESPTRGPASQGGSQPTTQPLNHKPTVTTREER